MRFTVATTTGLLRATYVPARGHVEFSDGRPSVPVGPAGSALDALRRAFPRAWVMDERGRAYPPLDRAAD